MLRHGRYRFYFYSHEASEPAHIHVDRDDRSAKLWLDPVEVRRNHGFRPPKLRRIFRIVRANRRRLLEPWDAHHEPRR
ncbi:MAG: DUF4160 domain-containing protein [Gemmatimonadota bacterium]